jgi:hypothetical protein
MKEGRVHPYLRAPAATERNGSRSITTAIFRVAPLRTPNDKTLPAS